MVRASEFQFQWNFGQFGEPSGPDYPAASSMGERTAKSTDDSMIVRTSVEYLRAFALAALTVGLLELIVVGLRNPTSLLPVYLGITWASGLWIAICLTAYCAALEITLRIVLRERATPMLDEWLRTVTLSASSACVGIVIFRPWDLAITWPYFAIGLGAVGFAAAFLLTERFAAKWLLPLLFCGALACFLADAYAYRRLYLSIHRFLCFLTLALLAAAFFRLPPLSPKLGRPVLLVALLSQASVFFTGPEVRSLGVAHGVASPKILGLVHLTVDADGDGFSGVFGGGDCNDSDARVHPGACETESDDRNCNGHRGFAKIPVDKRGASPSPALSELPDIYFVMVDTLRADYGRVPRAQIAPTLEAFSKEALDFKNAYTPYPSTFRAMLSTVQGRYWRGVLRDKPSSLEVLARAGYDARLWIFKKRLRIEDGSALLRYDRAKGDPFSRADFTDKLQQTPAIIDEAIAEMGREDAPPRFRWLHFMDPHAPLHRGDGSPLKRYRNEVRFVDEQFSRLLRALGESERGRQALVVFLSDHGEEFGDHGGRYHGATVYQENVHVPLMIRIPGVAHREIHEAASLIDIFPTLFDALRLPADPAWQGQSQLQGASAERFVFTQVEPVANMGGQGRPEIHAIVNSTHKLIHNLTHNVVELYDIKSDPNEAASLALSQPEITKKMMKTLARFQDGKTCQSF